MLALIQAVPPIINPDASLQWAEHLTLTGAMVVAIAMLWRALQAKDQLLVASTKTVTEALAASAASNSELRKIIEDSVAAKRQLAESIDLLRMELHQRKDDRQ